MSKMKDMRQNIPENNTRVGFKLLFANKLSHIIKPKKIKQPPQIKLLVFLFVES
jgi:hypothetical protein